MNVILDDQDHGAYRYTMKHASMCACIYRYLSINVSIFRRIRVNSRGLDGSKVDGPSTWNVLMDIYPSANVPGDGTLVPFQDRYTICLYSDEFGLRSADIQKPFQPHTRRYHYHHRSTPHSWTNATPQHVSPIDTQRMTMCWLYWSLIIRRRRELRFR